ncbi:hypothetical protein [Halorussus sp. AFM4]|uniref:hypothetical protein n=1 Tax=Halorussus sp. AFM4 TaxID=3421651 RepID=UPI003EBE594E
MLSRLVAWLRSCGESAGGEDDADPDEADGTVWDAIPSWQYGGLHVESGGATRDEQERALGDVRRQAEAMDAVDDDRR